MSLQHNTGTDTEYEKTTAVLKMCVHVHAHFEYCCSFLKMYEYFKMILVSFFSSILPSNSPKKFERGQQELLAFGAQE